MTRPSTEIRIRTAGDIITRAVVGLVLLLGGGFFLYLEQTSPPTHTTHILLYAGVAIFGAFLLKPDSMLNVAKQIVIIAGPYIPGGRRASDPPADSNTPPSQP
jgi:hypothetical protein